MIKQLLGFVLAATIMTTGAQALSKAINYDVIKQCKYNIDKTGKYDGYFAGLITGLAQGHVGMLSRSGIDNDYAGLNVGEFGTEMCKLALYLREAENKKTGGKYDVTKFYFDLIEVGYYMTLPPTQDTNTTN